MVFSLGWWATLIQTEFHVLRPTREQIGRDFSFAYGAITLCGRLFQHLSTREILCNSLEALQRSPICPATPETQRLQA